MASQEKRKQRGKSETCECLCDEERKNPAGGRMRRTGNHRADPVTTPAPIYVHKKPGLIVSLQFHSNNSHPELGPAAGASLNKCFKAFYQISSVREQPAGRWSARTDG